MASFTDKTPPTFNPYIQQLPVDAMVNVGTAKQGQYDQGVQRIQQQIDNIGGMDIVRDIDKQYLQSKLDSLGQNLKLVAAGDFSNFQLVNSVGGMSSQIAKDPNVLNAVASTRNYRQQSLQMQNDIKEGKASPANNLRFSKGVNEWFNSQDVSDSFDTNYIPPIAVWSKIKDVAEAVGVNESDIQQLYQTDEQGNVVYDEKTGAAKWNPIMVEKILKGKDAATILTAFQNALTPADFQQLSIDGEYYLAGNTPEMLRDKLIEGAKSQMSFANSKVEDLRMALYMENSKNVKDPERIESLTAQMEYFQKMSSNTLNSANKNIELLGSNPDAVRGSMYTNKYLRDMSESLSSQEVATKYSVSPAHTIMMDQNKFNRDIQNDIIKLEQWKAEQGIREASQKLDEDKFKAENNRMLPSYVKEGIDVKNATRVKNAVLNTYDSGINRMVDINHKIVLDYTKKLNNTDDKGANDYINKRYNEYLEINESEGKTPLSKDFCHSNSEDKSSCSFIKLLNSASTSSGFVFQTSICLAAIVAI